MPSISTFALIFYGLGTVANRYINTLIKIYLACQNINGVGIQLVFGYFTKFPGRVFKAQHIGVVLVLIKGRSFASE